MKSHITVLLDRNIPKIYEGLSASLEMFELDEEDDRSIESRHWDWWAFPGPDTLNITDYELIEKYPNENSEIRKNAAYVKNLPNEYWTTGIICQNGDWFDTLDYEWDNDDHSSPINDKSNKKWKNKCKEVLRIHEKLICVQVILHC